MPKSSLNLQNRHKKSSWPIFWQKKISIGPFSKIKKPMELKKAINYKFGFKKAKLATLLLVRATRYNS